LIEAFDETGTIDAAVALLISRSPHFGHLARVLSGLGPGAIGASLKIGDGSDSRPFLRGLDEVLDRIATIGLVKSNGAGNTIIRCKLYARFLERVGQVLAGSEGNSSEVSNATAIVPEMVDAAIITALEEELNALLLVAGNSSKVDLPGFNGRTYYRMTTPGGKTVVAVRAFGMGQVNAAVLATAITQSFAPGILLLTGIAGGINKVALGDVVVSDQIIDYELGKEMPGVQERRPQVYRASANLIDIAKRSSMAEQGAPWHQMIGVERPDGTAVSPAVHIGDVLCGNKVIADEAVVKALAAPWPSSRAIEMESSGVAAAIHQGGSEIPFLMVKGVSDLADAKKTNTPWRPYAARAAAAFVLAIVDAV
jgi:adenosylhomocysteine nucleosidase